MSKIFLFLLCLWSCLPTLRAQICGDGKPGSDFGWTPLPESGHCFQVITAPMDQPSGEKACQGVGGTLAAVHNNATHEFIGKLTRPSYDRAFQLDWPILRAFWIGMKRTKSPDGTYTCQWSDNSASDYACPPQPNPRPGDQTDPNTQFPWAPGQPSGEPEPCVHTYALYSGEIVRNAQWPNPLPPYYPNRWNDISCNAQLMGAVCGKPCANPNCGQPQQSGPPQPPAGDGGDASIQ